MLPAAPLAITVGAALALALSSPGTGTPTDSSAARPTLERPRPARSYILPIAPTSVTRGFDATTDPYGAGHRGVDLAATPGQRVRAASGGVVSFAGGVAGRGIVTITHPDGVTTEYEPVQALVAAGTAVTAGEPIALVRGRHSGCETGRCLHWGARRTGTGGAGGSGPKAYIDPLSLLRPLGPVRLLPL